MKITQAPMPQQNAYNQGIENGQSIMPSQTIIPSTLELPDKLVPAPLNIPVVNSLTPLPDIQEGFKPSIIQVGPIDTKNVLGVKDEGHENLSKGPYQYVTPSPFNIPGVSINNFNIKNTGFFQKGTYSDVGTDKKVYCREIGDPRFVSCGVPGNPYKYMPPGAKNTPISNPGYEAFRGMFRISGTGDNRLNDKIVFCRGHLGDDPKNPRMSCIGLNEDGSWNYANQDMGLGKLGNALDYFTTPFVTGGIKPPPTY